MKIQPRSSLSRRSTGAEERSTPIMVLAASTAVVAHASAEDGGPGTVHPTTATLDGARPFLREEEALVQAVDPADNLLVGFSSVDETEAMESTLED